MQTPSALPTLALLKAEARQLRQQTQKQGQPITHAKALEHIARKYGYRDWNTLRARASNMPELLLGMQVTGRYLGQPFTGEIRGLAACGPQGHQRITLHFDAPVDVVTFDSFSNYRNRVSAVITADGCSASRTSNGQPQLLVTPQ